MTEKRQNFKDLYPTLITREKKVLKYGISINIDLNNFDFEKENFSKNKIQTKIKSREFSLKEEKIKNQNVLFKNKLDELHFSNLKKELTLTIPKNKIVVDPIRIDNNIQSDNSLQQISIKVGEGSEVTIIDVLEDKTKSKGLNTKFVNIHVSKNSKVHYVHIQKINMNKLHYSRKIGVAQKNSEINWYDFLLGGKTSVSDVTTFLQGVGSKVNTQSIFFATKDQQFDMLGQAIHEAKETLSKVSGKGVVKNNSKALYRGNIFMKKNAPKSEGGQKGEILILDNQAEADAIPQLLIDNNDVKCSHAVAIGRIDREKLFYLMTRGVTEEEAKNEVVKGFFETAIKNINAESIAQEMRTEINRKLIK